MKNFILLLFCGSALLFSSCYPSYWAYADSAGSKQKSASIYFIANKFESRNGLSLSVDRNGKKIAGYFLSVPDIVGNDAGSTDASIVEFDRKIVKIKYKTRSGLKYYTWKWTESMIS